MPLLKKLSESTAVKIKTLKACLKPVCFSLVVAFMAWGLYSLRQELSSALHNAHWGYLIAASSIALIYLILNASVWGLVLQLVGHTPSRLKAAFLWIECEAMRWLPGGIWGYASRVLESKRLGVGKANGALSLALELTLTVTSWALLGIIGAVLSPRLRDVSYTYLAKTQLPSTAILIAALASLIVAIVILAKDILGIRAKALNASSQLRNGLKQWPITLRVLGEYLLLSLFYSVGFLFCLKGIGVDPAPSLLEACGSYGLAWIVGFVAFGAPGGMGVREGFLFLVFAPLGIGPEVATAAILWRAIQILVELSLLVIIKLNKLSPR